jgi:hypothetical protein
MPNCDLGTRPPFSGLEQAFHRLSRSSALRLREIACEGVTRTLQLGELGDDGAPSISLVAGVHGDEPVGPWAVLSTLEDGLLDRRFAYRIWPCTNPTGYEAGTRCNAEGFDVNRSFSDGGSTPESRAIVMSNRDRRFVLSIDVHEDHEADGFYCYVAGPKAAGLGAAVVHAIVEAGFSIQDFDGFDFGEPAGANPLRRCAGGVVIMDADEGRFFNGLSHNLHMVRRAAEHVATFESPRGLRWEERVAIHRVAIVAAIDYVASFDFGAARLRSG